MGWAGVKWGGEGGVQRDKRGGCGNTDSVCSTLRLVSCSESVRKPGAERYHFDPQSHYEPSLRLLTIRKVSAFNSPASSH